MKYRFPGAHRVILLLILCLFHVHVVEAQSPLPQIENLLIELWPEYDRSEVLVIYRVELSPDSSLPTQLTFRLPEYIETMHAVAVEQNGSLFDLDPDSIEYLYQEDELLLSFPTAFPKVQFEYYDPFILEKQNQSRQLRFEFYAPYDIETANFELQEPAQSENFNLNPAPDNSFIGADGLRYNMITATGLVSDEVFRLTASYTRNIDEPSIQKLSANITDQSLNGSAERFVSGEEGLNPGYLLLGAGLVLLAGTGGYWWWSQRRAGQVKQRFAGQKPNRRTAAYKRRSALKEKKAGQKERGTIDTSSDQLIEEREAPGFCYRCGAPLRPEANFCHKCGAERRQI